MKTDYLIFVIDRATLIIKLYEINGHGFALERQNNKGDHMNENGFIKRDEIAINFITAYQCTSCMCTEIFQ